MISDRDELHWKCLFTPRRPVVIRGDSFWGRVALKLVVTTLVCAKLVINLWRFAPPEISHCNKWPIYDVAGMMCHMELATHRSASLATVCGDVWQTPESLLVSWPELAHLKTVYFALYHHHHHHRLFSDTRSIEITIKQHRGQTGNIQKYKHGEWERQGQK